MKNTEKKEEKSKSFLETVPGIITALAALVTAIGGCIGIILASPRILDLILPSTPTPIIVTPAPVQPTDVPLLPPTQAPPTDVPPPIATQTPTITVLELDGPMSVNRLVGACAGGVFSGDRVSRVGFRVGVSPVEDCPPPSHWTTLLTFDISDLTDVTIVEAELNLADYQIIGDPFAEFGDLIVEEVSYADIGTGSVVLETLLKELDRLGSTPTRLDVTQALADAIDRGSKRFQLRLRFEIEGVNFRDFDEAIATPLYYLMWKADVITLNVVFSQ